MGGTGSGRRPKPTALHRLRGNPSKKTLNANEPQFDAEGVEEPPEHLHDEAKAEWKRIAPALIRQRVLTRADRAAFIAYCEAYAQVEHATRMLKAEGYTVASKEGGDRSSPWVRIRNQGLDQLRHWAAVFGLDPSTRSKIVAPVDGEDEFMLWQKKAPALT